MDFTKHIVADGQIQADDSEHEKIDFKALISIVSCHEAGPKDDELTWNWLPDSGLDHGNLVAKAVFMP
jgi:hypothetical protein